MKLYGVFIEPVGPLARMICSLKAEVERQLPGQKYCSHPPHCTVLVGEYEPPEKWRAELAAQISSVPPFQIDAGGFMFFYDDILAGGGHTAAIKIQPVPEVFALQKKVADCLKRWRRPGSAHQRTGLPDREPFRGSQAEYGFPFVGAHWIPHFTIASLRVAKDSPLLQKLAFEEMRHRFELDRISVWEIEGDAHVKVCEMPLGGGATANLKP